jgi:hypothetical protein
MDGVRARLVKRGWLYRCFQVETPEGSFQLEYKGVAWGERILIDGVEVARGRVWHMHVVDPHVEFSLAGARAAVDVKAWIWCTTRAFRLTVGGRVLYQEGSEKALPADPLLTLSTEVKFLERMLENARPRAERLKARFQAAGAKGGVALIRCQSEWETASSEVERLEGQLEVARKALGVARQRA